MKSLKKYYISWLWPLSFVFMQTTFVYYGSFPINIGFVSILIFLFVCFPFASISIKGLNAFLVLAFVILLYVFWADNYIEFIKSYVQIILSLLVVLIALGSASSFRLYISHAVLIMIYAGLAVACLIIFQAIFWNFGLLDWFVTPLGDWTPLGPGGKIYLPNETMKLKRPNGVYSEPSIAGWMMSYLVAISWTAKKIVPASKKNIQNWPSLVFSIAGILTGSLTGIVGVLLVWVSIALTSRKKNHSNKAKLLMTVVILIVTIILIGFYKPARDYFNARIASASVPGTSIYYRLVAPSLLVADSLIDSPLGHPVGQTSYIESKDYMKNWEGGSSTNIDNSIFLIVFYFGWIGLIAIFLSILWFIRLAMIGNNSVPIISAQIVALLATGALWSPWVALMISITIAVVNLNQSQLSLSRYKNLKNTCLSSI